MQSAGTVVHAFVAYHNDTRSKGYGSVQFATPEEAANAIRMFNHLQWEGRILHVREDRGFGNNAQQPPPPSHTPQVVSSHEYDMQKRRLFISNIPFECVWQEIKDLFRMAGTVVRVDIVRHADGRSKGFGHVVLETNQEAMQAIEMFNGFEYCGRTLTVQFDKQNPYFKYRTATGPPNHLPHPQSPTTPLMMGPPTFFPASTHAMAPTSLMSDMATLSPYMGSAAPQPPPTALHTGGGGYVAATNIPSSAFSMQQMRYALPQVMYPQSQTYVSPTMMTSTTMGGMSPYISGGGGGAGAAGAGGSGVPPGGDPSSTLSHDQPR
jgi:hypothetical protein